MTLALLSRTFFCACILATGADFAQARADLSMPPTIEQLQQALDRVKPGLHRIRESLGCVPAFGKPVTVRLCALTAEGQDFVQELPFQLADGRWDVVLDKTAQPPATEGACAPVDVAQAAFRKSRDDTKLRVADAVDDGEGIFTTERGVLRNKKGPYRLMCRYEVVTGAGKKYLFIAYVWHDGSRYIVDSDIEVWPDD